MTIDQALKSAGKKIGRYSASPGLDAEVLLASVLNRPKEFLYSHLHSPVPSVKSQRFNYLVRRRRQGVPAAYLVGQKEFFGLPFVVTPDTLVPRPESEAIVERSLELLESLPYNKILEIGTGSGCIILSLAHHLQTTNNKPPTNLYATDVSSAALAVARSNAKRMRIDHIKFVHSDLFGGLAGRFDLIIANLPYLTRTEYRERRASLRHEPQIALTDNTDKLEVFHKFFLQLPDHLDEDATVLLEIGPSAKPIVTNLARRYLPAARLEFSRDLRGLWRYTELTLR